MIKSKKSGRKAVEDYLSVVKKKLVKYIDIKKILEEELEQRSLLRG